MDRAGPFALGGVHHAECVEAMRLLPDGCVASVITDPPYSQHVHDRIRQRATADGYDRCADFGFGCLTDALREAVAKEFARLVTRWCLVFCDPLGLGEWRAALERHGLRYYRSGVWAKLGAAPSFHGRGPAEQFECVAIAHSQAGMRWNGGGGGALWSYAVVHGDRDHPCQKPVSLMVQLVRDFADAGEVVLDPFAGSGTTGVACRRLGRLFLGFEADAGWAAAANKRVAMETERLGEVQADTAATGQQIGLLLSVGDRSEVLW